MKPVIAAILLLFATQSGYANDMQAHLRETQELVSQGKHEEALERFIWFHNHALEHAPSMYGVRLSFALSYWKKLGEAYPPALAAMKKIRDENTAILLKGGGDHNLFHDVFALNRTLDEHEKSVELFEKLDQEQPERAKHMWNVAQDAVLNEKRYDLARKYIENPVREFSKVKASYQQNVTLYDDLRMGGERFVAFNENRLVGESLKLIELALAFDDEEVAREIRKQALSLVDDDRLKVTMEGEPDKAEPAEKTTRSPR